MEFKQLGQSDVKASAITFGAWAIGESEIGGVDPQVSIDAIRKAYDMGCTTIDTAACYGIGLSEEVVAKAVDGYPRDKIQILTKGGLVWEGTSGRLVGVNREFSGRVVNLYKYASKDSIIKQCEDSLKRLKTDYIDLYSLHWPDPTTPIEDTLEGFEILIQQGKIRAAGVCNHFIDDLKPLANVVNIASNKFRYSMLNRQIEEDIIPFCVENNKSILAFSILQRGLLTGKDVPVYIWGVDENPREAALYKPENRKILKKFIDNLSVIARDYGATVSQLCIRWTMDQPGITVLLLGATSPEDVAEYALASDLPLLESDRQVINTYIRKLELQLDLENTPYEFKDGVITFGATEAK